MLGASRGRLLRLTLGAALLAACSGEPRTAAVPPAEVPTSMLTAGLPPSPTQAPAPAAPTTIPDCVNDAQFLEDLTLPDGAEVLPGAPLDKRWLILNSGDCAWGPDYRLVEIGESRIAGPGEVALFPAVAGGQATWQVALVAPLEEGEFISRWRAQAPDGTLFGDEVYVLIIVDASPLTPTPIPTAASR